MTSTCCADITFASALPFTAASFAAAASLAAATGVAAASFAGAAALAGSGVLLQAPGSAVALLTKRQLLGARCFALGGSDGGAGGSCRGGGC